MSLKAQLVGDRKLQQQIKKLAMKFPERVREEVLAVALVDVESFAKGDTPRNVIPVDTGRLRASIHTKFKTGMVKGYTMGSENYRDDEGKTFDGTLKTSIDFDSVVVGTNVNYAAKINREGGGGESSRGQRTKGYGQGFWTRAVINGRRQLRLRMRKLISEIGGVV